LDAGCITDFGGGKGEIAGVDVQYVDLGSAQPPRYFGEVRFRITPEHKYPAPFDLTLPFGNVAGLDEGLLQGLQALASFALELQEGVRLALEVHGATYPT